MVDFKPLKAQVYDYVVARIMSGELAQGDHVVELQVCSALDVSRTPVREALSQLESDGYLESVPRRGYRVSGFDETQAREVFEILGPLDGRAALLSLPRMDAEVLRQMRFLCESMDLALDSGLTERYYDLQHEFHDTYVARCGNERLKGELVSLGQVLSKRSYLHADDESIANMRLANEEHRKIVALFEQGDGAALQDYIRDVHWSLDNVKYAAW
ncbi:MAG: GntR family transcriptional regulator [Atopobiaceae bacterium]|nr:GntR family transcriptional regulator [Atopobiaceae bacterium]MCI2172594.1 GntR family transcriptional regulator [Atopobiaceae bacterium]MCI2206901.1 GntR family transcriptional regulator [Atopobiaceae bacterium]